MTKKLIEPWEAYIAPLMALGFAAAATASVVGPKFYAPALAATGGMMMGAHVALERRRTRNKKTEEAAKVGKVFSVLYETNRGLISPDQLSYHAEITIDKADMFLAALCQQQAGHKMQVENGVVYSFPHTQNIIDTLTSRAAAWADQQTDSVIRENAQLKQTVTALQSLLRENTKKNTPMVPVPPPTPELKNNKEPDNPWNNLL